MADWSSVQLQLPEAALLADLAGVDTDLRAVEAYCDRFLAELASSTPDWQLLEIICAAAIIRYGRTFPNGTRHGVTLEQIKTLGPDRVEAHEYFKAARDKWIAHSVNTFEENQVRAWLMPPERGPRGVTSITVNQNRVTALSQGAIEALKALATELRELIDAIREQETSKVLALAQGLPVDELYERKGAMLVGNQHHPAKARSR